MSNPDAIRTEGELLFEKYLRSQGIEFEFEKQYPGKRKRPDYSINFNGLPILFDVKDFDQPAGVRGGSGAFDPYTRLREKINQGRDKFREFKEFCCALVLRNLGDPTVILDHPDIVLGSMYGDAGFTFPVNVETGVGDASKLRRAFLANGKMIRPHWSKAQNTSISALITLSKYYPHNELLLERIRNDRTREINEIQADLRSKVPDFDESLEVPRVIVWHNAVARIRFPDDLFRGSYDIHFGISSMHQGMTYRGNGLSSSAKPEGVPSEIED